MKLKNESDLSAWFSRELRKNKDFRDEFLKTFPCSLGIEFKFKKNKKRLNFKSDFKPQQIPALVQVQEDVLYWKISDLDIRTKPMDAFLLFKGKGVVIIAWEDTVYFCDVFEFLKIKNKQKSMSEGEVEQVARLKITV